MTTLKRINLKLPESDLLERMLEDRINTMIPTDPDFEQLYTVYLKFKKSKPFES